MNSTPITRNLFLFFFVLTGFVVPGICEAGWYDPSMKWGGPGTTVTYSFDSVGGGYTVDGGGTSTGIPLSWQPIITGAFNEWSANCGLTFVQDLDSGSDWDAAGATADIRITRHHFDGAYGTLAHGYYPPPNGTTAAGDVHFDEDEDWYVGLGVPGVGQIDLFSVALHEIGHAIGLGHAPVGPAVMDPFYTGVPERVLTADDISVAQGQYGASGATPEPGSMLLFTLCLGALYFLNDKR